MLSLNATLLGQVVAVLMVIMAITGYYLGKRKTQTPILTTIIAIVSSLLPPLALLFLMALVLKNDVAAQAKSINHVMRVATPCNLLASQPLTC